MYNTHYFYDWDAGNITCGFGIYMNSEEAEKFWNLLEDETLMDVEDNEHDFIHCLDHELRDLFLGFVFEPAWSYDQLNSELDNAYLNFQNVFNFYFKSLNLEIEPRFCVLVSSF